MARFQPSLGRCQEPRPGDTRPNQLRENPSTNFNQSPTTFYWVDAASSRTVNVNVTVATGSGSATTTFNVEGPVGALGGSGTLSATAAPATALLIDSSCGFTCAHYGPSPNGVSFSHTYIAPSGYSGTFQWVQTVSSSNSRTASGGGTTYWNPNPCAGLDTNFPYSTGSSTNDSPDQELLVGYSERTRSDSLTMTLMFQPSLSASISVPLSSVPWSWSFDATSSDGGHSWTFANKSAAGTLTASNTTTFPTWSRNITSCGF